MSNRKNQKGNVGESRNEKVLNEKDLIKPLKAPPRFYAVFTNKQSFLTDQIMGVQFIPYNRFGSSVA